MTARLDPARLTIATMPVRLEKLGDPVAPVLREESDIAAALTHVEQRLRPRS